MDVTLSGSDLRAGHHHGNITVKSSKSDVTLRVPYWYGVASDEPGSIAVLQDAVAVAGGGRASFIFRVTDTSGQALDSAKPEIEIVTDGGRVDSVDPDSRGTGLFVGRVRPGRTTGFYAFRIKAGSVSYIYFVEAL